MTVDQIFSNSIISYMYSSLLLVLLTYLEPVNLGAHSISLGIHFFINALMLGLVNFCHDPNLGLMTKTKAWKGAGRECNLGVTFALPKVQGSMRE
jgi:hypothetical protein